MLPEQLDIKVTGVRLGTYVATSTGWFIQAYGGLGVAESPSDEEVIAARNNEGVMIDHNGIFAHLRLVMGYQLNLTRKKP